MTDDYEPQGMMGGLTSNIMADEYEVRNFSEAEELFHDYIEKMESGGDSGEPTFAGSASW